MNDVIGGCMIIVYSLVLIGFTLIISACFDLFKDQLVLLLGICLYKKAKRTFYKLSLYAVFLLLGGSLLLTVCAIDVAFRV